jgi:hypothetical protein
MPVKIRNLTSRLLLFSLNSGTTLRLEPGGTSGELGEAEVTNNAKVDKLQGQRVIAVERTEQKRPAPTRRRTGTHARVVTDAPDQKEGAAPIETKPAAPTGE